MPLIDDGLGRIRFLSTPSARRATKYPGSFTKNMKISIHALREEGDLVIQPFGQTLEDFYPRPPRGGRQIALRYLVFSFGISIHALREEGDSKNRDKISIFL